LPQKDIRRWVRLHKPSPLSVICWKRFCTGRSCWNPWRTRLLD